MLTRQVVVTGLSALTGFGGLEATWSGVLAGKSSAQAGDPSWRSFERPVHLASRIANRFGVNDLPQAMRKSAKFCDQSTHWTLAVANDALRRAGLAAGDLAPERLGISLGHGPCATGVDPQDPPGTALLKPHPALPIGILSQALNARGEGLADVSTCTAGLSAIGRGFDSIATGRTDAVVCVGVDHALSDQFVACFAALGNLSPETDPQRCCRPFNAERQGLLLGEGCGCVVLEERGRAERRNAKILAEVGAWCTRLDAAQLTAPNPEGDGLVEALRSALDLAGVLPGELGYINAHGTGTALNDPAEIAAFRKVLGGSASSTAVSSSMGATGHTMGAAGAIGAVFAILALAHQLAPPTANLETIDPACEGVRHLFKSQVLQTRAVAKVALGFFGINAAMIFTRPE